MMGATVTETAAAATAVRANSEPGAVRRRLADRLRPSAARTRIIGWVLLLVFTALGLVTFVTWRLLIAATDARMQQELRFEMQQFAELTAPGVNPRTGMPFASVDEVIREAIAYNVARPNEKFLGYVDGQYRVQSRPQVDGRATLAGDVDFSERVASITDPARGTYRHPQLGEVVYAAVPVTLTEDPARGVIVAAYLADAERGDADAAARLMLIVGAVTLLGAVGAAWLVAGRILRPLRDITETARTITETDLSQRIPRRGGDGDELGDLVATVNGMLDRVETGVAAQRRFIDDAGHELRTPITIIRGHLDVLDPTDPADVTSTVALVDDELERMIAWCRTCCCWHSPNSRIPATGRRNAGCSDCASSNRSDTMRFIRSSSSSTKATVEVTSAGSVGSSTSRCPRMIVIGVRNSWPASSMNRRWAATPVSTRSSIPLTVATRSPSSSPSPPRRGMRCDRSVSVMVRAVSVISRSGRKIRPATSHAAPTAPNRVTAPTISMSRAAASASPRSASAR